MGPFAAQTPVLVSLLGLLIALSGVSQAAEWDSATSVCD